MRHRRRDTVRATAGRRNVDASATSRQSTGQNDVERRRRRRRHHSVNETISRIDVRVPLRLGQDAGRPVHAAAAEPPATSGVEKPPPEPVAVVVDDDRPSADQSDRDRRSPSPAPLVLETARRTAAAAARGGTLVGVDLRRLGRRCRSLDNVHAANDDTDQRTYALLMIAN